MNSITHDTALQEFYVTSEHDDNRAVLQYTMLDPQRVDFFRTFVPPSMRHQGIAEALVKQGLAWAAAHHYAVQGSCWYVDRFLHE